MTEMFEDSRPTFTPPAGVGAIVQAAMVAKAARSWCVVTGDGRPFYLDESRAHRFAQRLCDEGDAPLIWPPVQG